MEQNRDILMEKFMQVFRVLHRYQHKNAMYAGPHGNIHRGQGRVLAMLNMKPDITQKELAYLLDMRPQSLGELLVKLEKSGYITRTQSEKDRRAMDINLTEEGKKVAEQTEKTMEDFGKVFDFLPDDEKEQLEKILTHIVDELEPKLEKERMPGFDMEGMPAMFRGKHGRPPFGHRGGCDPQRHGHMAMGGWPCGGHSDDPEEDTRGFYRE